MYRGSGTITGLTFLRTIRVGQSPYSASVADFDRDGDADILAALSAGLSFVPGDGSGGAGTPVPSSSTDSPQTAVVADFDKDGDPDVAMAGEAEGHVRVGWNDGTGRFGAGALFPATTADHSVHGSTAIDLNRDGITDLVSAVSILTTNGYFGIRLGLAGGGFGNLQAVNFSGGAGPLFSGDFNGDGIADLVMPDRFAASVLVVRGDGNGGLTAPNRVATPGLVNSVAIADFDRDGDSDLITANSNGTLSVLTNNGSAVFSRSDVPLGTSLQGLALADLDGDGALDAAVGDGARVVLLRGNGAGAFTRWSTSSAGDAIVALDVGDLNGDGRVDAAVATRGSVRFMLNRPGGFAIGNPVRSLLAPTGLHLRDVDGDGRLDAVVAGSGNAVAILKGDGSGGTIARTDFGTGNFVTQLTMVDINRDGLLDLLTANSGSRTLSVLYHQPPVTPVP